MVDIHSEGGWRLSFLCVKIPDTTPQCGVANHGLGAQFPIHRQRASKICVMWEANDVLGYVRKVISGKRLPDTTLFT